MLDQRLKSYKIYEEYLQRVIEAMPEDYLPSSEDKVKGLMMRHRTLSESNKGLINNLEEMTDELETSKKELDMMKQEYQKVTLSDTSTLSHMQEVQEDNTDANEQMEQTFQMSKAEMRSKRTEVGVIFMAINNIYDKCRKLADEQTDKDEWIAKLNKIQDYLVEREGVVHLVNTAPAPSLPSRSSTPEPPTRSRQKERHNIKMAVS